MASFNLFVSNRMKVLAEHQANTIRESLSDSMQGDIVIVQNQGRERWISMQLSLRHGGLCECPFPLFPLLSM
jgi:exonuclease V gamma subunit